jgi:SAM-dependent methyltransferase
VSGADQTTVAVYDQRAADYADIALTPDTRARLDAFIAALPAGGSALDLGCGPGWAAAAMRDAGLTVAALDAAPAMAEVAQARYGLSVTVATFDAVTQVAAYDGIWAHFSLLHAPRADFPAHLAALHRALRPGGQLFLAMKLGTGEGRDRLDRFYSYFTADELRTHLRRAGFTLTGEQTEAIKGFDGTPASAIYMRAHA